MATSSRNNHPTGTTYNRWSLYREKQRGKDVWVIRRWCILPGGKKLNERLPKGEYKKLKENESELQKFVDRLNYRDRKQEAAIKTIKLENAFVDLPKYEAYLKTQIPRERDARAEMHYLQTYFLRFFIKELNLKDPMEWHSRQTEWAEFLLSLRSTNNSQKPKSPKTLRTIVIAANRFMKFMHSQHPEIKPLAFQPISRAKFKSLKGDWDLQKHGIQRSHIEDADWKVIEERLPNALKPFVLLAFHYGLRRSEVLGLKSGDVRKTFLSVERQLKEIPNNKPVYGILKGKEPRRVPHWSCTAAKSYEWIEAIQNMKMHPDTLSERWANLMHDLSLNYDFHDLRHTWVTRMMLEKADSRQVQLAAGHKNIETTMKYSHDNRNLDDAPFVPKRSA